MSECMQFPDTWEEFEQAYGFEDKKEIYTNGSRLIQSFRVKQWLDHIADPERKKGKWLPHPGDEDWDVCSVCGTGCKRREHGMTGDFNFPWVTEYNYQYCPNCGSDMRGER